MIRVNGDDDEPVMSEPRVSNDALGISRRIGKGYFENQEERKAARSSYESPPHRTKTKASFLLDIFS